MTLENIIETLSNVTENVEEGNADALTVYGELKDIETYLKQAISQVFDVAIDEAEKEDKTFQHAGFKFERRAGATRYSFKHIPQWNVLNNELKAYESELKSALKMQGKIQMADNDGEELVLPTVTVSKDSLIVKRK